MGNGFWAGDAIAQSMETSIAAQVDAEDAKRNLNQIETIVKLKTQAEDDVAANLAEKLALRTALAKLDPKHPLLTNASLRERIQEAGVRANRLTNNYDAAREVGKTFKY